MRNKIKIKYIVIFITVVLTGSIIQYLYTIDSFFVSHKTNYQIKNDKQTINIHLEKKDPKDYVLIADVFEKGEISFTNSWPLKYEIFKVDTGDVNNDNSIDILVGVIKPTRFDSISRKRLFIFKLYEGYIRPLWLGSRVSKPLVDFKFYKSKSGGIVRTIELEKEQSYLVAEYHWIGFGLGFIHYLAREKTKYQAYKILNTTNEYELNH
jgi:hypothetical protein